MPCLWAWAVSRSRKTAVGIPATALRNRLPRWPLGVVHSDDRVRPAGTRQRGQDALPGIQPITACVPPSRLARAICQQGRTAHLDEVSAPQPPQVSRHRIQHRSISGRDPQPGRDRGARRPSHGLHPAPVPQPHRRHPASPASTPGNTAKLGTTAGVPTPGLPPPACPIRMASPQCPILDWPGKIISTADR
jgi:hypothetical protein